MMISDKTVHICNTKGHRFEGRKFFVLEIWGEDAIIYLKGDGIKQIARKDMEILSA